MRSWAIARLPSEAAKCNGVLESRGLTGELTSSWEAWASTKATDFMSDLSSNFKIMLFVFPPKKNKFWFPTREISLFLNIYLQMASTRLAEVFSPGGKGARNSLLLYFAMINLSLSSCEEVGSGLGPFSFCSQILFAIELPKADITAKWPGGHSSRSSERTLDMCEPNFRWTPEHSMQISTPRLMLAQSGSGRRNKKL